MFRVLKYIPFQLSFFLCLGVLGTSYVQILIALKIGIICSATFLLICFQFLKIKKSKTHFFSIITWVLFYFIGDFGGYLQNKDKQIPLEFHNQREVIGLKITETLKASEKYAKYKAFASAPLKKEKPKQILLYIKKEGHKPLKIGSVIVAKGIKRDLPKVLNPHVFDFGNYLRKQKISYQLFLNNDSYEFIEVKAPKNIMGYFRAFKERLQDSLLNESISKNELAVLNALLLGDKNYISKDLYENYTRAGVIHILAVSGLHVGILMLLFSFLLKPLHSFKWGKLVAGVGVLLGLWSYALLVGLSPSVVRSVTMFSIIYLGMQLRKITSTYHSIVLSIFILVLINPNYLTNVGFQLSYLAVIFIVWLYPKLIAWWCPKYKIGAFFWRILMLSLAAQLGVLPLSIYYFHQFPTLFFLSNLVIIPLLGIIYSMGIGVVVLVAVNQAPNFLILTYEKILELMNRFVIWIAKQEAFLFQDINISLITMFLIYGCIILFFLFLNKKSVIKLHHVFMMILVFQGVSIYEKWERIHTKEFLLFHHYKRIITGHRIGAELYINLPKKEMASYPFLKQYKAATGTRLESRDTTAIFFVGDDKALIISKKNSIKTMKHVEPTFLILHDNPTLNLERVLLNHQKIQIIASGANYKTNLERWKKTCAENDIPFWNLSEEGVYRVSL